ncbi:MAG: pyridoxal-phosphate dependent enzyme [Anaerolineales bacterium]|jgi:threonine synthase|nr:pyridoxal-phosphate dependent enzyme [Anaerolineales bacterium]
MEIVCTNCGRPYPEQGTPYKCPKCGGLFDWKSWPEFDPAQVEACQPGLWRYRHAFGATPLSLDAVSLGEGQTPLVWVDCFGRQVACKCEFNNPSGSFKDRGMTILVSFLKSRGVRAALEDSSGNAGASFAAYAARAGFDASVYVPAAASGPKLEQIQAYGAKIFPIAGARSQVARAAEQAVTPPAGLAKLLPQTLPAYASHAWMPQVLAGYATAAYEIYEQIGGAPGAVICPVGQGGLFLGLYRGFEALQRAGLTDRIPRLVGVQARACAPLWALATAGSAGLGFVTEGETVAEGIRIRMPLRAGALLQIAQAGFGEFVVVDEPDILPGRDQLAKRGLYVEPTSAILWNALEQKISSLPNPVVAILTGSGLKYQPK